MLTILRFLILPVAFVALMGWVLYCTVQVFLDDLGGPGDGPGYT